MSAIPVPPGVVVTPIVSQQAVRFTSQAIARGALAIIGGVAAGATAPLSLTVMATTGLVWSAVAATVYFYDTYREALRQEIPDEIPEGVDPLARIGLAPGYHETFNRDLEVLLNVRRNTLGHDLVRDPFDTGYLDFGEFVDEYGYVQSDPLQAIQTPEFQSDLPEFSISTLPAYLGLDRAASGTVSSDIHLVWQPEGS